MSEMRICPVCENEFPADAKSYCPGCGINLQLLDIADERTIEKAKLNFSEREKRNGTQAINSWNTILPLIFGIWLGYFIFVATTFGISPPNYNDPVAQRVMMGQYASIISVGLFGGIILGFLINRLPRKFPYLLKILASLILGPVIYFVFMLFGAFFVWGL